MNLSEITTLKIGGPAKKIIEVKTETELFKALQPTTSNPQPILVIGGGSNLLVSDQGFDGTIIQNKISGIKKQGNNLIVKSGTILQDLIDFANQNGLSGLQSLAGIPGTVGGAIYGNAGAYGQTISGHLKKVKILRSNPPNPSLSSNSLSKLDCNFSYRDSIFKTSKDIILEAEFELFPGNPELLKNESSEIIKKREIKYPPGIKCPGSFFKNIVASTLPKEILDKIPPQKIIYGKLPAGTLLEMVGANGDSEGHIKIASYHANLFINEGNGTAQDFYNLAKKYHQKVKSEFGITLEPEVQLINLPPLN